MKILVVCQYYHPEPFRITDICESLVKDGHQVSVLTGLPNYPEGVVLDEYKNGKKRSEIINGVNILRCFEFGRGKNKQTLVLNYLSFLFSSSLKAFFMKNNYDVVFVNQLSPITMAIPAIILKKRFNTNVLLYCLDLWPASIIPVGIPKDSVIYKFTLVLSKWIYGKMDVIALTSKLFGQYFIEVLKHSNDNLVYLPQYAESIFEPSTKSYGDMCNFVFAGNIGEMQSVETLIYAASSLRIHNIRIHIVGDGSRLTECKRLVDEYQLDNVIFHGRKPLSEMPEIYKFADAMLLTLIDDDFLSYTLPGKVQSYLAAGKPIIGAINGEARIVIDNAACGYCCEAENAKKLAENMLSFSKSGNKEKSRMSKNAFEYYEKNFTKRKFMQKLCDELENLGGHKDV